MQSSTTSTLNLRRLIRISLAAAIICVVAPISIPVPVSPVPITLTTFILLVLVYVLGWKDALAGCALYLALGAFGLPVFSGFSGGLAKLTGPTGGYLLGFLLFILISGLLGE
ncbi:biotin transporter BioY, partial [Suipraeoptans intestinalis]